jgi:RND family efflux transporter MFP subunit
MKKLKFISMVLIIFIAALALVACSSSEQKDNKQFAVVTRGNAANTVISDGNLVMSKEIKLKFGTPGVVQKIYVEKGDHVKAGKLLAKIDDKAQRLAVTAAQYDVELSLNELAERVYPALLGYPHYYPSTTALFRVDQALDGLNEAKYLLGKGAYTDTAIRLRVATHDLEESQNMMNAVITDMEMYPDIAAALKPSESPDAEIPFEQSYPSIPQSIELLKVDIDKINSVTKLLEGGYYQTASSALTAFIEDLKNTRYVVNKVCGRIVRNGVHYPDASTSLDILQQVQTELKYVQDLMTSGGYDPVKLAEKMRTIQHDLETSHNILEKNDLIFKSGVNLKVLRQLNINMQKAEIALQKAKDDLMKTEILAPFDGVVVDINVKENDQLSAYDYSSRIVIQLVDTTFVKMEGVVDEVDIFKVKVGQKAIITLDALPGKEFPGIVTFISPFSTQVAGVVNFPINIVLDKTDTELKGGLTSTANIIISGNSNTLVIPNGALQGTPGNHWVEVLREGTKNETEKRTVKIGGQNDQKTEIISGLKEEEKVLVNPIKTK